MGCDIHGYIEIKTGGSWREYAKLSLPRDYYVFSNMAGVRGNVPPKIKPKGLPQDCVCEDFWMFVSDEEEDNCYYVTRESAQKLVDSKRSSYKDENKSWVSNPDWHTPSWLSYKEYKSIIIELKNEYSDLSEWEAVLAILKQFKDRGRFTFWFDN